MFLRKTSITAVAVGVISSFAVISPAQAVTVSETNCVLKVPAKIAITRADYYKNKTLTFTEADLTCPDEANPFKATNLQVGSWIFDAEIGGSYAGGGPEASYVSESELGSQYGAKRIELPLSNYSLGLFKPADKVRQHFIKVAGDDMEVNTGDDVYYPLTFSNSLEYKYQSDVSVKTKKSGNKLKLTVKVDRNQYDWIDGVTPKYIEKNDKVTVYRDGKAIKTVKVNSDGKATFTIKDKKGKNNYSVVLPSTFYNFEGSASFVR